MGRSRGGLTTKIHLLADALGRPLRFLLTGGEAHESRTAQVMLDGVEGDAVTADKAYGGKAIRDTVKAGGMKAVILATTRRPPTSSPSSASPDACYGCAECRFSLVGLGHRGGQHRAGR